MVPSAIDGERGGVVGVASSIHDDVEVAFGDCDVGLGDVGFRG